MGNETLSKRIPAVLLYTMNTRNHLLIKRTKFMWKHKITCRGFARAYVGNGTFTNRIRSIPLYTMDIFFF